jgi:hypothetical protein
MTAADRCQNPLFIVGTERSGSNLLRVILDTHPRIDLPHPPHIMKYFARLEPRYGDLSRDENLRALARDVLRLLDVHIHPWQVPISLDEIVAEADPRDLFGVFVAVYEAHRRATGKPRWGCKSTFMIHHAERVLRTFPEARFIWLVRDPRDVAVSSRKSVFSPYHPLLTAQLWAEQQRLGLALEARYPRETLRVRYEDLLADPEDELRRICCFLGEIYDPRVLRFFDTEGARRSARLSADWNNTARPILKDNTRKYRKELDDDEVWMVEVAAREEMEALGYELEHPDPGELHLSLRQRLGIRALDEAWHMKVELRSLREDKNHWRRWGRGAAMLALRALPR